MGKGRLEAFSDGVLAIVITIMVLELKVPHESDWSALAPLVPLLITYALSFVFIGIYWSNHHHLLQATRHVNGTVLWANLHLLFWLSLIPFVMAWMGESHFGTASIAAYGVLLLMSAVAYTILVVALVRLHGRDSTLARALGSDLKGKVSIALYSVAIPLAFYRTYAAYAIYILVAIIWLIPDRRLEKALTAAGTRE